MRHSVHLWWEQFNSIYQCITMKTEHACAINIQYDSVICFLVLKNVMSIQAVRKWCCQFKNECISVVEKERAGQSASLSTDELREKIDAMIQWNHHVCLSLLADQFGVAFGTVQHMVIGRTFHSDEEVQEVMKECVNNVGGEIWFRTIYDLISNYIEN